MYNSIILSANIVGSFYLFSQSVVFINKSFLENRKMSYKLYLINGIIFVYFGTMIIWSNYYIYTHYNLLRNSFVVTP